jgi:hypothetical protein
MTRSCGAAGDEIIPIIWAFENNFVSLKSKLFFVILMEIIYQFLYLGFSGIA